MNSAKLSSLGKVVLLAGSHTLEGDGGFEAPCYQTNYDLPLKFTLGFGPMLLN